jgi:hypothetical protein
MTTLHRLERAVPTDQPTDPPTKAAPKTASPPAGTTDSSVAVKAPVAKAAADAVAVTTPKQDRPPVDKSLFAVVLSPDRAHTFADIRPDVAKAITSWNELPAILQDLRQRSRASGEAVVLDLAVHGNNGTGLKVVSGAVKGEVASITSIAEVNRMVKAAGFAPGEIVILTEGCNVHRSWTMSADGFTSTEKQAAIHQAQRLSAGHGGKLAGAPEIVDRGPTKADTSYLWLGRGPGTNWISTVFLQYVTGREAGAPLQDLRQYKNPKAPMATQTEEVMHAAGMRPAMLAALKPTRFAPAPVVVTGSVRFADRLAQRIVARPASDDSAGAPTQPFVPPNAPATTQTQPAGTPPATTAPATDPAKLVPVQIRRQPTKPATVTPQPMSPPAQPADTAVADKPAVRFIDRLKAVQR